MECSGRRVKKPLDLLTICVLILQNGFTVTGESLCVSPENFNAKIGRKAARQKVIGLKRNCRSNW
ncbi:TPA: hypothetical protein H2R31_004889 [Salmonella enterica]|nr:hypothetical protein [Salmonella enterica]